MLNYRTITAFAFLLALLAHYGFMLALPFMPAETPTKTSDIQPIVTTVQGGRFAFTWERDLLNWAQLGDPSLIPLPHIPTGFSSVRKAAISRPQPVFPQYSASVMKTLEQSAYNVHFALGPVRITDYPPPGISLPREGLSAPASNALPKRILWRTGDGYPVAHMPRQIPNGMSEDAVENPPERTTWIEIQATGEAVRVRQTQSSGNETLDNFALRLIGKRVAVAEGNATLKKTPDYEIFFPVENTSRRIEIEWRLALMKDSRQE